MSTSIPGVPGPVNCVIHRHGDGRVECATHGFAVDANVPEPEKTDRVRAHIADEGAKWKERTRKIQEVFGAGLQ